MNPQRTRLLWRFPRNPPITPGARSTRASPCSSTATSSVRAARSRPRRRNCCWSDFPIRSVSFSGIFLWRKRTLMRCWRPRRRGRSGQGKFWQMHDLLFQQSGAFEGPGSAALCRKSWVSIWRATPPKWTITSTCRRSANISRAAAAAISVPRRPFFRRRGSGHLLRHEGAARRGRRRGRAI